MYVVEEWLSSTEPGLQIDSPPLPTFRQIGKKYQLLINHFKFKAQISVPVHICISSRVKYPLPAVAPTR